MMAKWPHSKSYCKLIRIDMPSIYRMEFVYNKHKLLAWREYAYQVMCDHANLVP